MTDLSPQAQAIIDAYDSAPFVDYDIGDRVSIAAVLRAVATNWRIDTEFIGGVEYICTSTLDKIADELEGKLTT